MKKPIHSITTMAFRLVPLSLSFKYLKINRLQPIVKAVSWLCLFYSCLQQSVVAQCTTGCTQSTNSNSMPGTNNFTTTFCITTASSLTYNQNFDMNGGTLCIGQNVTFSATAGNYTGSFVINNYGTFSRNLTLTSGQVFNNFGTFTGSITISGGTVINFSGAIFTPGSFTFSSGSFNNNTAATATLPAAFTVNSVVSFVNNGSLTAPALTLSASSNATLGGNTTITGNITNSGTIFIAGTINVSGTYFQATAGVVASQAGGQCNALNVTTSIQGRGNYNGSNGLLLSQGLTPSCPTCLTNGTSTTPPGQPSNQVSGAVLISVANNINGTIVNPGGSPAATHYIVLRRFGTAVTDQPNHYINYTVGSVIGNSTVVAVKSISSLSFSDTNAIATNGCGTYHYAVFPYNSSVNCGTYNRTLNAANTSAITVTTNAGEVGTSKNICSGSNSGILTLTGYTGSVVKWQTSISPFTTWTDTANTSASFTSAAISQITHIRAVVNAGTGCSDSVATAAIITPLLTATISSYTPNAGYIGSTVTITGINFSGITAVTVGGMSVDAFTVVSPTTITALLSANASGAVAVTNICGTASLSGFTFYNMFGTTWTGAIDNDWLNDSNWSYGNPATSLADLALVLNVTNGPSIISDETVPNIILQTGSNLSISNGHTLSITADLINNGSITGNGNLAMEGSGSQYISGTGNINNLVMNNSAGCTINSGIGNMQYILNSLLPTSGTLTTNDNLTLKSCASKTARIGVGSSGGNYISGKITLERYIPARRSWRLMTFPFYSSGAPTFNQSVQENAGGTGTNPNPGYGTHITGGATLQGFDTSPTNGSSLKEWVSGSWHNVSSTNVAITNRPGYMLFIRGSRAINLNQGTAAVSDNTILRASGNIRQGSQSQTFTGSGWQMVGNPFPSAINMYTVATANNALMNNSFLVWDPKLSGSSGVGGYITASYNGSGYDYAPTPVSSISQYVQQDAVFFVNAISAGTFIISESDKTGNGSDNVFRSSKQQTKFRVDLYSVSNNGNSNIIDGIMAGYDDNFDNSIDGKDAVKLPNTLAENICLTRHSQQLAIERRKTISSDDTLLLNMSNMLTGNYQLLFTPANFDSTDLAAFVLDNSSGNLTPIILSSPTTFNFFANASFNGNRFSIVFKKNNPQVVLPVTISSISASLQNNDPIVDWVVENQLNIASYQIEKSINGRTFSFAGSQQVMGNSTNIIHYKWIDKTAFEGVNYYRIKAVDRDGTYKYSQVVKISRNKKTGIHIYPNPVENHTLRLEMNGQAKGKYLVELFGTSGNKISSHLLKHTAADNTQVIVLNRSLAAGSYSVKVIYQGQALGNFKIILVQ